MIILRQKEFSDKKYSDDDKKSKKIAAGIAAGGVGLTALTTAGIYKRDSKKINKGIEGIIKPLKNHLESDFNNEYGNYSDWNRNDDFTNKLKNYRTRGKYTINGDSVQGLSYKDTYDFLNSKERSLKKDAKLKLRAAALKKIALPGLAITGLATGAYLLHRHNKKKKEKKETKK